MILLSSSILKLRQRFHLLPFLRFLLTFTPRHLTATSFLIRAHKLPEYAFRSIRLNTQKFGRSSFMTLRTAGISFRLVLTFLFDITDYTIFFFPSRLFLFFQSPRFLSTLDNTLNSRLLQQIEATLYAKTNGILTNYKNNATDLLSSISCRLSQSIPPRFETQHSSRIYRYTVRNYTAHT